MIAAEKAEEQLKLEEAKKPVVIDAKATGDTDLETLEVVQPLPPEDPSAYR